MFLTNTCLVWVSKLIFKKKYQLKRNRDKITVKPVKRIYAIKKKVKKAVFGSISVWDTQLSRGNPTA